MTVNRETPIVRYTGNGSATEYTFQWSCDEANENYVEVNGVQLIEGVEYELEDFDREHGGTMRFLEPPAAGDDILIYRRTPITQQVDYVEFDAFPAEVHEGQMDKDTRILQEIIDGGLAIGGPVDLNAVQYPDYVEIENSSGTNAILPLWECDADFAGVFAGEITTTAPNDGDTTTKPDGYVWFEVASLA